MKKLFALTLFVGLAAFAVAQTSVDPKASLAAPKFENQTFDFGKIKQGEPVTHEFKFTNSGSAPMIITNVTASCGCTTPDWTKDIIPPGGKGFVRATYNAASPGAFNKSVTVTANVENGFVQLFIKGEVTATLPQ
jgi:hypothetical protein